MLDLLQVDSLAQEEVLVPHQDLMLQPLVETDSPTHMHTHMPQPMQVVETDSPTHIQTHMPQPMQVVETDSLMQIQTHMLQHLVTEVAVHMQTPHLIHMHLHQDPDTDTEVDMEADQEEGMEEVVK